MSRNLANKTAGEQKTPDIMT